MTFHLYDPPDHAAAVERLLEDCVAAGDIEPLSEGKQIAAEPGGHRRSVIAFDDVGAVALGRLVAYAGHTHATETRPHHHPEARWEAEFVVHPRVRDRFVPATVEATIGAAPLDALLEVWAPEPYQAAGLRAIGWVEHRSLHRLEVRPVPDEAGPPPSGIGIGPFVPGRDDAAFLTAKHAAFADHPEQASWDAGALRARLALAWFDRAGFLVARRGAEIVGFCWTKVRPDDPTMGEIFLIGVVPGAQGIGLGSALIHAGLSYLARERGVEAAMLYTGSENDVALALYRRIGFQVVATKPVFRAPRGGV